MNVIPIARAGSGQLAAHAVAAGTHTGLLRFITAGSVDDGKSTLIGRLLYDSKSVDRKSTRLNSSHNPASRMPSSA
jgi:sulfate adenylyltransferase subunit 1